MSRDRYFRPALSDADALMLAQEDVEAMERRRELPDTYDLQRKLVRQIADAYIASNRSTMRAQQLLTWAGERWMQAHGKCEQHGIVDTSHRCRNYDGEQFGPNGYAPQGYEAAREFLSRGRH